MPKQHTDAHNFGLRDKMMRYAVYERFLFHPFIGDIKVASRSNVGLLSAKDQITMPGDIVWRLPGEQFVQEGTDFVHMPLLLKLEQPEKYGSHWLIGTGETLRHKFRKMFINQMSGVVNLKKNELDKLRTDKWERYYDLAEPQLIDWFSERMNANFISAFYEGHNIGVTEGLNNSPDGIGAHVILHPNMWYKSAPATMTPVGTLGMCKSQAEVTTGVTTGTLSTIPVTIADMYAIARTLSDNNIQKGLVVDGQPLWLAVINLQTWHTLVQDAQIRGDYRAVATSTMYKNYLYAPTMYRWGDFAFLIDDTATRSWHSARAGSPNTLGDFAGNNGYHGRPTNAGGNFVNTTINIYGKGSMGYADVRGIWTKFDEQNFDQQKEMSAMAIYGLGRNDWIAKALEATFYACGLDDRECIGQVVNVNNVLNQSSAIFIVDPV